MFMPLGTAKSILDPRIPCIAAAFHSVMAEWNGPLAGYHATFTEFERAVILSRLWYAEVSRLLKGDQGIEIIKNGTRECCVADDQLLIRLKHAGAAYRTWNYPTKRARAWENQAAFPGIPPLYRLDIAYRLDLTGTVMRDAVVMPSGGHDASWHWQIWGEPVTEFAARRHDLEGEVWYAYDDHSGATP